MVLLIRISSMCHIIWISQLYTRNLDQWYHFRSPYDCGIDSDFSRVTMRVPIVALHTTLETTLKQPAEVAWIQQIPLTLTDFLSGMQGTTVELESDNATNMDLELWHTENGVDQLIADSLMVNGVATVDTSSISFDELDGNYFVLVNANETGEQWDTGWYNLTFTPIAAPLPDLVAEPATCPITAETTGYTAPFMAQVSSVGGPMDATAFAWELAWSMKKELL